MESGRSGFKKRVTEIGAVTSDGSTFYRRGPVGVKAFLDWLVKRPEKRVFSNNVQYDLGNLFRDRLDCLDLFLVGGRLIFARWKDKLFLDCFNLWHLSVAALGNIFDLPKLKMNVHDKEYVLRDCQIVLLAVQYCQEIAARFDLDLPGTVGSLAIKIWKSLGGVNTFDTTWLSREALFGGRVELFKVRNEQQAVFTDINSLYPSTMLNQFPGELIEDRRMKLAAGVARVELIAPETLLGVLPTRDENGRICYPYGRLVGSWTYAEIRHAVKQGCKIRKIYEAMGSNELSDPYSDFVNKMYAARLVAQTPAEREIYKRILNNLWGRLGTKGIVSRTVKATAENIGRGVRFGSKVLIDFQMPLADETNWCHAAHVCSYGRLALFGFMQKAGPRNLIYTDTDSLIFDWPAKKELPFSVSKDLGAMKLVGRSSHCVTYAPKMYQFGGEFKAKGVPKRMQKTFIEDGRAEYDLPFSMRESIAFFDREDRLSVWRRIVKEQRGQYDRKTLIGNSYFPKKIDQRSP